MIIAKSVVTVGFCLLLGGCVTNADDTLATTTLQGRYTDIANCSFVKLDAAQPGVRKVDLPKETRLTSISGGGVRLWEVTLTPSGATTTQVHFERVGSVDTVMGMVRSCGA